MLIQTSRDPGAPPVDYIKVSGGIYKDMLIHDFDVFRWILDDEAGTVYATGSCLTDPAIGKAGDVDSTAVTIRTRRGRLGADQHDAPRAYGYDQRFEVLGPERHAAGRQPPAHRGHRRRRERRWRPTCRSTSSSSAIASRYAQEMAHFVDAIGHGKPLRTTIDDGLRRSSSPRRRRSPGARSASSRWDESDDGQYGIVGIGRMGKRHAENLAQRVPGASLVAACSPIAEELAWARDTLRVPAVHERYEDLLARKDVDAVFIVTPNALHPENIIAALRAGKHVFCEKPLGMDVASCEAVEAEAAKHPRQKAMIGYVRRFDASYEDAHAKIEQGLIGRPSWSARKPPT
jgi:predicted dehydrogenase